MPSFVAPQKNSGEVTPLSFQSVQHVRGTPQSKRKWKAHEAANRLVHRAEMWNSRWHWSEITHKPNAKGNRKAAVAARSGVHSFLHATPMKSAPSFSTPCWTCT